MEFVLVFLRTACLWLGSAGCSAGLTPDGSRRLQFETLASSVIGLSGGGSKGRA